MKKIKIGLRLFRRYIIYHIIWPMSFLIGCLAPFDEKLIVFAYNKNYKTLPDNMIPIKKIFEEKGFNCYVHSDSQGGIKRFLGNIKFQFLYAKCAAVFISDNFDPVYSHKPRKKTRVIQLWHACGAFKKWGYSTLDYSWGDSRLIWKMFPRHFSYTDVFVSAPSVIPCYSEAFNCSEDIIRPLGTPRTDVFFDEGFVESGKERLKKAIPEIGDRKVILYAPTFRGSSPEDAHNNKKIDYQKFLDAFGDDYVLLLKFHPFTLKNENFSAKEKELFGDFVFMCPPEIGIDTAMCAADILVSDYSSLVFEFSLLNRPMIFFAYDLEEYQNSRDYYFEYTDFVPGPIVKNSDELLEAVLNIVNNGCDAAKISEFKEKFMSGCDGKSSQRISDFIIKKITE